MNANEDQGPDLTTSPALQARHRFYDRNCLSSVAYKMS